MDFKNPKIESDKQIFSEKVRLLKSLFVIGSQFNFFFVLKNHSNFVSSHQLIPMTIE